MARCFCIVVATQDFWTATSPDKRIMETDYLELYAANHTANGTASTLTSRNYYMCEYH